VHRFARVFKNGALAQRGTGSGTERAGSPPSAVKVCYDGVGTAQPWSFGRWPRALYTIGNRLQVLVRDNNVDQALRALKKKMQREGVFREMKLRKHYEKPSVRKAREKAEAVRRARKLARKQAIREGLIAAPKRPARAAAAPRRF
jgi:small subunit ribosomal protein S21